jgi:23S rRNA pseudouridine2457 synthase
MLIALHKPFGVLSQFTSDGSPNRQLGEFSLPKEVYPIGRLDADSEGLLLLSDEPRWNDRLLHPRHAHQREYWVQVERIPTAAALEQLQRGVLVQGRPTLPCRAWRLEVQNDSPPFQAAVEGTVCPAVIHARTPPIRFRKSVPDCWLGLELIEGKNRQVRRMTAAVGHPTLRLLRVRIGRFWLGDLPPGQWRVLAAEDIERVSG